MARISKSLVNFFSLFGGLDLTSSPLFLLKIFNGLIFGTIIFVLSHIFCNFAHEKTIKYHNIMDENQLKVDKELKDSMTFFCEGLQIKAEPNDMLERYDHYFKMYCNHFKLVMKTWYDLRIANLDAQVYLMMQPQFVRLVVTPYDYMRYIDCLDCIVTIYQSYAQKRLETKK